MKLTYFVEHMDSSPLCLLRSHNKVQGGRIFQELFSDLSIFLKDPLVSDPEDEDEYLKEESDNHKSEKRKRIPATMVSIDLTQQDQEVDTSPYQKREKDPEGNVTLCIIDLTVTKDDWKYETNDLSLSSLLVYVYSSSKWDVDYF